MGKKRKVGGEEGEVVKEAAAPKVHNTAYPLVTDLKCLCASCPGCQAGGKAVDHRVGGGAPRVLQDRQGLLPAQHRRAPWSSLQVMFRSSTNSRKSDLLIYSDQYVNVAGTDATFQAHDLISPTNLCLCSSTRPSIGPGFFRLVAAYVREGHLISFRFSSELPTTSLLKSTLQPGFQGKLHSCLIMVTGVNKKPL